MLRLPSVNRNKRFLFSFDKLEKKIDSLLSPFYWYLGPLDMSPQSGCSVTEMNVVVCSLGNVSQETKPKWWNLNLYRLRLLYGFVDCFNFTTTSAVEKHTSQKSCHFCHCCWDSKAILSKNDSSRSPGLNSVIWKNFHPQYRDLGRKFRDFGNRGSPASHLKKLNFFFRRKERRGDISEIEPAQSTGLT